MIEFLVNQSMGIRTHIGPSPIDKFTTLPRSNASFGLYQDTILVFGGQAGGSSPYPTYGYKINLTTRITTQVSIYAGTWATGFNIGDTLYTARGHDGNYNSNFMRMTFPDGVAGATFASGKTARTQSIFVKTPDGLSFHYGAGINASGALTDFYRCTIATNTWTTLASIPTGWTNSTSASVVDESGKIYKWWWRVIDGVSRWFLGIYDPVNNSWGYSSPLPVGYIPIMTPSYSAFLNVGKYILMFGGQTSGYGLNAKLRVTRYNIDTDQFDVFIYNDITARYSPSLCISDDKSKIYLVSGIDAWSTDAYDNKPRSRECLIFNTSDFLIE